MTKKFLFNPAPKKETSLIVNALPPLKAVLNSKHPPLKLENLVKHWHERMKDNWHALKEECKVIFTFLCSFFQF